MSEESKVIAVNRKAWHDYEILETLEAGIALQGSEIKSIRAGRANLRDAYVQVRDGEAWLLDAHISPYSHGGYSNHEPTRPRKLLLHKDEIARLAGQVAQRGYTIVPLRLYLNKRGRAKVEIGLVRGKKEYDKRQAIAKREADREIQRSLKERW